MSGVEFHQVSFLLYYVDWFLSIKPALHSWHKCHLVVRLSQVACESSAKIFWRKMDPTGPRLQRPRQVLALKSFWPSEMVCFLGDLVQDLRGFFFLAAGQDSAGKPEGLRFLCQGASDLGRDFFNRGAFFLCPFWLCFFKFLFLLVCTPIGIKVSLLPSSIPATLSSL
jgi:hypothetical protein